MMRFITMGAFLSVYFIFLYKMEVRNKKIEQDRKDAKLIESFSRFSDCEEVQDAYNRQYPVFDHNAYVVDGDTLATENI